MLYKASTLVGILLVFAMSALAQNWPAPISPAIPEADGYVVIPNAAVTPDPKTTYRVIFDGSKPATKPGELLPAVNAAGNVLNDLLVGKVPQRNRYLAVIFHGPAVDGILDDAYYRAKYGVANPNLPVLTALKKQGVELLVCGQHLAAEKIDPKTLSPDIKVASDAYLVLINYQNRGYALMLF